MKLPIIIGVVVIVVAVAGYLLLSRGGMSSDPEALVTNALTGSGSVKCEYTDENGALTTAYMKDGKIRTEMAGTPEGTMHMILKDETVWSWSDETKEGMVMRPPSVTPMEGEEDFMDDGDDSVSVEDSEEIKAEIEKYKESCKNESIADSLFEAPSDVNFIDYAQMMDEQMQNLPAEYRQMMQQ